MESLLPILCVGFLAGLAVLLWVLLTVFGRSRPATPRRVVQCPGCGRSLTAGAFICRWCGLRNVGAIADELADLAATARQLERFRAGGEVDERTAEILQASVALRRRELLRRDGGDVEESVPVRPAPVHAEPVLVQLAEPAAPTGTPQPSSPVWAWRRLEDLLENCPDVTALTPNDRVHALLWFRQSESDQLARMSAAAQLTLARLLRDAGRNTDALRAYWRLLDTLPRLPGFVEAALEAGRLALAEKAPTQARWFFQQALSRLESPERRREVEELLRLTEEGPAPRPKEEIADVLPVVEEPVVRVAQREAPAPGPAPEVVPELAVAAPPIVRRPRRSVLDLLTAFMEARNILWGELVGGLLIVGCSFGLAMYLQTTHQDNPYLPSFLFSGISAALIGAGLYTLRHWKLDFTSRGLLVDGLLMVPLVFPFTSTLLASALLGDRTLPVAVAIIVGLLLVFAGLVSLAARVLVFDGRWLLPVVVIGAGVSQVLVAYVLQPDPVVAGWRIVLLGSVPVACLTLGSWGTLVHTARRGPLEPDRAKALLAFLGIAAFAVAAALGFQVKYLQYWGLLEAALQLVAVPVAVAGVPVLATGLLIHQGLPVRAAEPAIQEGPDTGAQHADEVASLRTVGTGLALGGMLTLLGGVALAWPSPRPLILAAALDFVVLTFVAVRHRLPVAHAAALPCLVIGSLTAYLLLGGYLDGVADEQGGDHLIRMLLSVRSGVALVALVSLVIAVSQYLTGALPERADGKFYAVGGAVLAALSLALVTYHGPTHPLVATAVYALYGTGCLALNLTRWRRPILSHVGLGLLLGATLWALRADWFGRYALYAAVLATEALALAVLAILLGREPEGVSLLASRRDRPWYGTLMPACRDLAGVTAFFALVFVAMAQQQIVPGLGTYAGVALTATALLLAWSYGTPGLTWVASTLLLGVLALYLPRHFPALAELRPGLLGLLGQASIALAASLGIRMTFRGETRLQRLFAEPLGRAALLSSLLVFPFLLRVPFDHALALSLAPPHFAVNAVYLTWLAAVWLAIACSARRAVLFTAFQLALTLAVLCSVSAGLVRQEWFRTAYPGSLGHPWSLQAFGIGLGVLVLAWVGGGIALDRLGGLRPVRQAAAPLRSLSMEWSVISILVCGQLGLALWGVIPGAVRELTPLGQLPGVDIWPAAHAAAFGVGAWLLLAALTLVLLAALWTRMRTAVVLGLVVAAVTVPILVAGPFETELATASALRWGLGLCFLAGSAVVWLREPLGRMLDRLGSATPGPAVLPVLSRDLLMLLTVGPVLALTAVVAFEGFGGTAPSGPLITSFFADAGWVLNHVVPLTLVSAGLVGYSLRERSAGFAFAGGVLVEMTVMGGYALGIVTGGQPFGLEANVVMLQLGTITAGLWALAWLASRWYVDAWRERPEAPLAGPLMSVQLYLSAAGNMVLLFIGLWGLFWGSPPELFTLESGSVLGWLALVLASAAGTLHLYQRRRPLPLANVAVVGLAAAGLLACSAERIWPGWGYRTLMIGWAVYDLAFALGLWRLDLQQRASRERGVPGALATGGRPPGVNTPGSPTDAPGSPGVVAWVPVAGLLVVFLGLWAAVFFDDHVWAAAAITLACSACGVVAAWKRQEAWALAAAFGMNLAVSLVVWHCHQGALFEEWWIALLQANVVTAAVLALGWLWARQRLRRAADGSLPPDVFVSLYVAVECAANLALLALPMVWVFLNPDGPPDWTAQVGRPGGWLALVLGMSAAAWYVYQVRVCNPAHLLGALLVGLGVLAACAVRPWDEADWLCYHVLTAAWVVAGTTLLAVCWAPSRRLAGDATPRPALLSFVEAQGWLNGIGVAVVVLAVRGAWDDPARPWWSASAALAVSVLYAALAVWWCEGRATVAAWARRFLKVRRPVYVDVSGLLVNLTGTILWLAWGPRTLDGFVCTNLVCFAIASACWSVQELVFRGRTPPLDLRGHPWPFSHLSVLIAVVMLAGRVLVAIGAQVDFTRMVPDDLAWLALGATALAAIIGLWDREAGFTRAALYTLGLTGIGLALHTLQMPPRELFWTAGLALAGYVLGIMTLSWGLPLLGGKERGAAASPPALAEGPAPSPRSLSSETGESEKDGRFFFLGMARPPIPWPEAWFVPAQGLVSGVVVLLSLWVSVTFGTLTERLAGPLAVTALVFAGILGVLSRPKRNLGRLTYERLIRYATLALGVLTAVEVAWTGLDPADPSSWLHRNVVLMTVLAAMTVVYGVGLARLPRWAPEWAECGRRLGPVLGVLASVTVLVILAHEAFLYNPLLHRAPMALPAAVAVAAALVTLIAGGVAFAVLPGSDPFGLSERARTLYVYGSEVLLALLYLHLRLTVPEVFHHINLRYVPFIILGFAYLGVGLGEFFRRQGQRVLAEPLQNTGFFLPVLPVLAFWTLPAGRQHFGDYAVLWFLVGTFFGAVAVLRGSLRFALLAALSANLGLWVLLYDNKLSFLSNPQLWLIPGALIALVAEYLNRDRLTAAQSNAVRYLALTTIYVSSTAEMFLRGLAEWPWGPVVLAFLAVLGVLAGMLLRVRSFLLLGVLFLVLDVVTEICHAAGYYTWIWWASGILLGVAILTLFALFEKRRNDLLRLIEAFKKWQ